MSDTPPESDPNLAAIFAGTLPYPGFHVHLYLDNSVVIYQENTQTAVKMKIGDLMMIFNGANNALQEIKAALVTELEAAKEKAEAGVDDEESGT